MIEKNSYRFLYLLFFIAIGFGMFLPLMENDNAQHATMAMQMAKDNQYFEIWKGLNPYLDKPHMHFWLSAFSFEIFGFHPWAYRLPAILLTFFASFSLKNIAVLLGYSKTTALWSQWIFLSSLAILISLFDVRTDAVLVAFTIFATWQWLKYFKNLYVQSAILGGLFTAFAYSTKGLFAIAVMGLFLFFYVLLKKQWKKLLSHKLIIGILSFFIGCIPMFYAYYHQFGLEGIEFITYGQSFGRFKGEDFGTASQNDYTFYFHTILWAFAPWSLWFYYSVYLRGQQLIYQPKNLNFNTEYVSAATVLVFMIIMNFSSFKLPHYLNIILPFASIATASVAQNVLSSNNHSLVKLFKYTQNLIILIGVLALGCIMFAFPFTNVWMVVLFTSLAVASVLLYQKLDKRHNTFFISVSFILLIMMYMNSTFYPKLLTYQSNLGFGEVVKKEKINPKKIFNLTTSHSWNLDWALQQPIPQVQIDDLPCNQKSLWVLAKDEQFQDLLKNNYTILKKHHQYHYRITRLKFDFINPNTRDEQLENAWLLHIQKN